MILKPFLDVPSVDDAMARAGARWERRTAFHLDEHFGASPDHVVLHDLRLRIDGRAVQIDHLVLNRFAEAYVIETKSAREGLRLDAHGDWALRRDGRWTPMRSPIHQTRRQAEAVEHLGAEGRLALPRRVARLGQGLAVRWAVVIGDDTPFERPDAPSEDLGRDLARIVRVEALGELMRQDLHGDGAWDFAIAGAIWPIRLLGRRQLETLGRSLAALHMPPVRKRPAPTAADAAPACEGCGVGVTANTEAYCRNHPDRYDGQVLCWDCQAPYKAPTAPGASEGKTR